MPVVWRLEEQEVREVGDFVTAPGDPISAGVTGTHSNLSPLISLITLAGLQKRKLSLVTD